MTLKFKNRIAWFNTLAAALSTLVVFTGLYFVVYRTVYRHLDNDIRSEYTDVLKSVWVHGDSLVMLYSSEWNEKEHKEIEVHPVFLQITQKNEGIVFHSSNLKNTRLPVYPGKEAAVYSDNSINAESIRQGQFPVFSPDDHLAGYITIGISQAESSRVLENLLTALLFAFPMLCAIFFFAASYAAAKGIQPVHQLIEQARQMDDHNIGTPMPLPPHKDEIYQLVTTINDLLQRIEASLVREKQITADISHELRTPLAGIRGTLEVMLRKKRDAEYYEQKAEQVLSETDRMNRMLEQILHLARIEAGRVQPQMEPVNLRPLLTHIIAQWTPVMAEKQQTTHLEMPENVVVRTDQGLLEIVVGNLLGNAVKYGRNGGNTTVQWDAATAILRISDDGPGIEAAHLPHIFDRFYRADMSRSNGIPGTGLGLAIARKLCDLMAIRLSVTSTTAQGATFYLHFL